LKTGALRGFVFFFSIFSLILRSDDDMNESALNFELPVTPHPIF
jgi:hypothetical protein